jgi:hypothetical protein
MCLFMVPVVCLCVLWCDVPKLNHGMKNDKCQIG